MSVPSVELTIIDNAIGILPDSVGEIGVVMGCSTSGPFNKPLAYARGADLAARFGFGDAVEAAAMAIERAGKPVIFVRLEQGEVDGYVGFLDVSGVSGSSSISLDPSSLPWDEYEGYLVVTTGGTIGTPGIKFRWSMDGGRNLSPITALGSDVQFEYINSGDPNVILLFGSGTLVAGDVITWKSDAPKWDNTTVSAGMEALGKTFLHWNFVYLVGNCTAANASNFYDELDKFATGKLKIYKFGMANYRRLADGETEADYLDAFATEFADNDTFRLSVSAGYAKVKSSITRREYRRPAQFSAFVRAIQVDIATDLGQVDLGPLDATRIKDAGQNPEDHDEYLDPGLDDQRALTLRSFPGFLGVFVNNPRLMSAPGSDFEFIQHIRVMNKGCEVAQYAGTLRLNKGVKVNKTTGFIVREAKLEIESAINSALRQALLAPGYASDVLFTLSPSDNILVTKTLHGDVRITSLGYVKDLKITIGFKNPVTTP